MDRPPEQSDRLLGRFGVSAEAESVWQALLASPAADITELARQSNLPPATIGEHLNALLEAKLVRHQDTPSGVIPIDPTLSVETLAVREERELLRRQQELADLRARLPALTDRYEQARAGNPSELDLEVVVGIDEIRQQIYLAVERTVSDHRSLYDAAEAPGALQHALQTDLDSLRRGVRQRSIVGVGAITEPEMYDALAVLHSHGEEVRTLAHVPTRMLILDEAVAILAVDYVTTPRRALFLRDRTAINVFIYMYENLWTQASPVFDISDNPETRNRRHARVLELLATGSKDEAIARALDVGVRTIRRDVAELKCNLGVTSRTEIAAAAVRKGWL